MKEQYCYLDKNNKPVWNFRDIGHTVRRISEDKGMPQRPGIQPGSAGEAFVRRKARHKQMFAVLSEREKDALIALPEKVNEDRDQKYGAQDGT